MNQGARASLGHKLTHAWREYAAWWRTRNEKFTRIDVYALFDRCVGTYSWSDAVREGLLVNLMVPTFLPFVRWARITQPCAMTADAFAKYVRVPQEETGTKPSEEWRLWNILTAFQRAYRPELARPWGELTFSFPYLTPTGEVVTKTLTVVCHKRGHGELVLTFMLPEAD